TAASSSSGFDTSVCTNAAWPPAELISSAAARPASSVTSARRTRAPSRANSSAATLPIPLAAPVMSATLPSSLPTLLRLPDLRVQDGRGAPALQAGDEVLGGEHPHGDPGVHRGAAEMREDHHVLQLQQLGMDLGLLLEDIQ